MTGSMQVFIQKNNNIKTTVEGATYNKAGIWTHTCLSCGRDIRTMPVIKDTHNGIGGFTTTYRCACGKDVTYAI